MRVNVEIKEGDYDRQYAEITVGGVTIVAYESNVRPGGVSVEIDTDEHFDPDMVKAWVNDWPLEAAAERLT